jgi:hypothetical protein
VNTLGWVIVAGIVVICYLGAAIIKHLALIVDRLGVLADAAWHIRDELAKVNKQTGV